MPFVTVSTLWCLCCHCSHCHASCVNGDTVVPLTSVPSLTCLPYVNVLIGGPFIIGCLLPFLCRLSPDLATSQPPDWQNLCATNTRDIISLLMFLVALLPLATSDLGCHLDHRCVCGVNADDTGITFLIGIIAMLVASLVSFWYIWSHLCYYYATGVMICFWYKHCVPGVADVIPIFVMSLVSLLCLWS